MTTIATVNGSSTTLGDADVGGLRSALRGDLVLDGDAAYQSARAVWNGNIDRRPALIARCTGPADVQQAVNFARARQLKVSVRGGGHSAPGYGTNDGGFVIDLSPMKGVRVDPAARTARAQGGVLWRDLDHETQAFGLATTGGTVSNTGIAGPHAGRRPRLADGQARAHRRQPALRRRRDGRRPVPRGQRHRESGSVLGAAGRRRQLRRRHVVRVPAPSGERGRGRAGDPSAGPGPRGAALLPRLLPDPAGRGGGLRRRADVAGRDPRRRADPRLQRPSREGPRGAGSRAAVRQAGGRHGRADAVLRAPDHARRAQRQTRAPPLLAVGLHGAHPRRSDRRARGGGRRVSPLR